MLKTMGSFFLLLENKFSWLISIDDDSPLAITNVYND